MNKLRKNRKTILFTIVSKKNQIPRNKLNKGYEQPVHRNYKPLKKEIEEDCRR
jgi:hypothetical protein